MSSAAAAARAEARRKAILSRGNDRLNKLTTSARGEDHPAYANVDVPSRKAPTTETFVGEESIMPTPPVRPSPPPTSTNITASSDAPRPSAWTSEQQQEFMRALMSVPDQSSGSPEPSQAFGGSQGPGPEAGDESMAAMLNALAQMTGQSLPGFPGQDDSGVAGMNATDAHPQAATVAPRSLFSKLRPLLHLFASWILLVVFAFVMEPKAYESNQGSPILSNWDRWAELAWKSARKPFGVQPVPFFWAFITLQLVLHSITIFTKSDPIHPPALLAMILPVLPPQFRSLITNVLAYARMGGMLLDDIAGLLVGVGILIWVSGWLANSR